MTKTLKILLLTTLVAGVSGVSVLALQLKPWHWKKYRINFKLPTNWTVKDKGGKTGKFTGSGPGISFTLKPWRDGSRTAKDVAMAAFRSSTSIKSKRILNQKYMTTKGGLKKYMVYASGMQKKRKVTVAIMGFVNPNSTTNLYARFFWWSAGKNAKTNSTVSYQVANSFAAY